MPDRKPVDLSQTFTEKETGIVDPYAEAQRAALRQGVSPRPADRVRAQEAARSDREDADAD